MKSASRKSIVATVTAHGGILVFAVVALEVMIMISPFAFFFYSVFGPIFNWLDRFQATTWLTGFFLPHMILPPTSLLKAIRILGSVLFLTGAVGFVVCASQVYLGKLLKWGIAQRGVYRFIRHPQYLALGIWGAGMSILWARFIVLVSLSMMLVLYYFLAKDEERRMLKRYGESYRHYMANTGMFLPRAVERRWAIPGWSSLNPRVKNLAVPVLTAAVVISGGFLFRTITLHSLSFASVGNLSLVTILPEDSQSFPQISEALSSTPRDSVLGLLQSDRDYLGYVMPPDYIMQGMIANTGSDSHLFKHHNTWVMITDWVLHPFAHLRRPPSAHMARMHNVDPVTARRHHCPLNLNDETLDCATCPYRRVIVAEIRRGSTGHRRGSETLSLNAHRVPIAFFDIDTSTGRIVDAQAVEPTNAWGGIPTPSI